MLSFYLSISPTLIFLSFLLSDFSYISLHHVPPNRSLSLSLSLFFQPSPLLLVIPPSKTLQDKKKSAFAKVRAIARLNLIGKRLQASDDEGGRTSSSALAKFHPSNMRRVSCVQLLDFLLLCSQEVEIYLSV